MFIYQNSRYVIHCTDINQCRVDYRVVLLSHHYIYKKGFRCRQALLIIAFLVGLTSQMVTYTTVLVPRMYIKSTLLNSILPKKVPLLKIITNFYTIYKISILLYYVFLNCVYSLNGPEIKNMNGHLKLKMSVSS